ncbi:MAG: response regulator [Burkholderiales bacterium]|nr:response regulator [Burkholderiales bacterium]
MRILLVEDNPDLALWLAKALKKDGYSIDSVQDGNHADLILRTESYDLVILDLGLPGIDGHAVLKRMRSQGSAVPVLVLTANTSLKARVDSLDLGADDYLAKPFELAELEARIRALLRRAQGQAIPLIRCGDLAYDSVTREFTVAGQFLSLTPREQALLEALIGRAGRTMSKEALAASLFALNEDVSSDAIEVYVHRIRKKLEGSSASVITLRGLGYILKPQEQP